MNRFLPDSLLEALLRPFAMATPSGWVYLEVIAPDLRFLFIAVLLLLCAVFAARLKAPKALFPLTAFLFAAFVPWLLTTGNGRYFIPLLVLSGIVCIGLAHALPLSRGLRLSLALMLTGMQGFALMQNQPWNPWNGWDFHVWREGPVYALELDDEARKVPATYVTLSTISYSLIAPQFAPDSQWINVSSLLGAGAQSPAVQRARAMLTAAPRLRVVLPAASMQATPDGQPLPEAMAAAGKVMELHNLHFARPQGACKVVSLRPDADADADADARQSQTAAAPVARTPASGRPGFWICEASYQEAPAQPPGPMDPRQLAVFAVLEQSCPRLFPGGQQSVTPIPSGLMRHYASADMKVYVFRDGSVYYKYHRALNPVLIGTVDKVTAAGFVMSCDSVPGRSGMPWQRDI